MPKAYFLKDELYVWTLVDNDDIHVTLVDVDEAKLAEWRRIFAQFNAMQDELYTLLGRSPH